MALSLVGCVAYAVSFYAAITATVDPVYILILVMTSLPGLLLTLLYLFLDCCCPCCSHSPALQESVMLPGDPLVEYVKIRVRGKRVVMPIHQI